MEYKRPNFWSWFWLGLVSFVILTMSYFNTLGLGPFGVAILVGVGCLFGFGSLVGFLDHAGVIVVDLIKEGRPDTYKLSQNYLAELIKTMNRDQLKAWGRFGNARIGILTRGTKGSKPVAMVHHTDVSRDFLFNYLDNSTEYRVCPVSNYQAGTHHWDWSKDEIIDDYEQAQACRTYLVQNGWATWAGNGTAPVWALASDGTRWKPEEIKQMHILQTEEQEGSDD